MPLTPDDLHARARRVRLLLFDVDGVLTDSAVVITSDGTPAMDVTGRRSQRAGEAFRTREAGRG